MLLYFAGGENKINRKILDKASVTNILMSYFYTDKELVIKDMETTYDHIFIDSGGYSARKKGVEVDISKYAEFLDRNRDNITVGANLDVSDLQIALNNEEFLSKTYPVIPVYHMQEYASSDNKIKHELLETYCREHDYIAVGGVAGTGSNIKELINFLRFVFKHTMKTNTRVHGFGITNSKMLLEFPFYSVDSTSWMIAGTYGTYVRWDAKKRKLFTAIPYKDRYKMLDHKMPVDKDFNYKDRMELNAIEMLKMQKDITKIWKLRGIDYSQYE